MLTLPPSVRVFLALDPVDMRGSFDSLAGLARRLSLDPQDGHLYCFVNRRRTLMKILLHDRRGWWLHCHRLEQGTFEMPGVEPGASTARIDPSTLSMIIEGIALGAPRRLRYGDS